MSSFLCSLSTGNKTEVWGDMPQVLIGLLALNDALLGNWLDQMMLLDLNLLCDSAAIRDQRDTQSLLNNEKKSG